MNRFIECFWFGWKAEMGPRFICVAKQQPPPTFTPKLQWKTSMATTRFKQVNSKIVIGVFRWLIRDGLISQKDQNLFWKESFQKRKTRNGSFNNFRLSIFPLESFVQQIRCGRDRRVQRVQRHKSPSLRPVRHPPVRLISTHDKRCSNILIKSTLSS